MANALRTSLSIRISLMGFVGAVFCSACVHSDLVNVVYSAGMNLCCSPCCLHRGFCRRSWLRYRGWLQWALTGWWLKATIQLRQLPNQKKTPVGTASDAGREKQLLMACSLCSTSNNTLITLLAVAFVHPPAIHSISTSYRRYT